MKVAVTPALENRTKTGIRLLFESPKIIKHNPPTRATENQIISVNFIPILLYMKPLSTIAGNSLNDEVKVLRKIFPYIFFI